MRSLVVIAVLAAAVGTFVFFSSATPSVRAGRTLREAPWRRQALWDDGRAEFAVYAVEWNRYGRLYDGRAQLILVKEPWAPELDVKADEVREDGFDVLKLNHLRDVQTGVYTYHQMASVFMRRDDGSVRKLTAMSSEACGLSTAHLRAGRLELHSYHDGQADRRIPWPEGAVPEDGLPAFLRDFVAEKPPATLGVFPTLMTGSQEHTEAVTWNLSRREGKARRIDQDVDAVTVRLERGDSFREFTFDRAAPHVMLGSSRDDGTTYRLLKVERIRYWVMNDPDHATWLPR